MSSLDKQFVLLDQTLTKICLIKLKGKKKQKKNPELNEYEHFLKEIWINRRSIQLHWMLGAVHELVRLVHGLVNYMG